MSTITIATEELATDIVNDAIAAAALMRGTATAFESAVAAGNREAQTECLVVLADLFYDWRGDCDEIEAMATSLGIELPDVDVDPI